MWATIKGGAANAADALVRTVDDSNNTLTDMGGAGAISGTTQRPSSKIVAVPGGGSWDTSKLSGVKGRVGFATDVSPQPRWLAFALQYAFASAPAIVAPRDRRARHLLVR
jgi:hypothetical protein